LRSGFTDRITRGDYCTVLARVLLQKDYNRYMEYVPPGAAPFSDTNSAAVWWLSSMEIVYGVGGDLFNPDGGITRQEAAIMLRRAALAFGVSEPGQGAAFADLDLAADWAVEGLGFVSACGIMNGKENNLFDPLGPYTREEAYITMVRLFELVPDAVQVNEYMGMPPEQGADNADEPCPDEAAEPCPDEAAEPCPDEVAAEPCPDEEAAEPCPDEAP